MGDWLRRINRFERFVEGELPALWSFCRVCCADYTLMSLIINLALGWPGVTGAFLPSPVIRCGCLLSCLLGRKVFVWDRNVPFPGRAVSSLGIE